MKNVGTGKYLKTNDTAKYDDPTYFSFCSLKDATSGVSEKGIVDKGELSSRSGWYTLDGRKLYEKPTRRGLYIANGKKVVIK